MFKQSKKYNYYVDSILVLFRATTVPRLLNPEEGDVMYLRNVHTSLPMDAT